MLYKHFYDVELCIWCAKDGVFLCFGGDEFELKASLVRESSCQ